METGVFLLAACVTLIWCATVGSWTDEILDV
jgi:hypothetical protein